MVDATVFPSKDPASTKSLGGGFAAIFRKQMESADGQLPAVVLSYDRVKNIAKVMPLVTRLDTAGNPIDRETIASVPVLALGGGGFMLTFPLQRGDIGWIEASDRDISLFMQSGRKKAKPNTLEIHSFASGRFIPDAFSSYTIASEDANAAVLQSADNSMRVSLDATHVRVRAGTSSVVLNKNGDVVITRGANSITINAAGVAIVGALSINGKPYVNHYHNDPVSGHTGGVIDP